MAPFQSRRASRGSLQGSRRRMRIRTKGGEEKIHREGKHLTGGGEELVETQVMFKCVEWRKRLIEREASGVFKRSRTRLFAPPLFVSAIKTSSPTLH